MKNSHTFYNIWQKESNFSKGLLGSVASNFLDLSKNVGAQLSSVGRLTKMKIGNQSFGLPRGVSNYGGLRSILQIGSGIYSIPGLKANKEGRLTDSLSNFYNLSPEILDSMTGIGSTDKDYLAGLIKSRISDLRNLGGSVTKTTLGSNFTAAFYKSYQVDLNSIVLGLPGIPEAMTVSQHLEKVRNLYIEHAKSGGIGLSSKAHEALNYHMAVIKAIQDRTFGAPGMKVHVSSVKDTLFREHGIASLLAPEDIGFAPSIEQQAKGIHRLTNVAALSYDVMKRNKILLPAVGGRMYAKEVQAVNEAARIFGIKGNRQTRFAANVFFSLGEFNNGVLGPHRNLADSFVIGGQRMFNLFRDPSLNGARRLGLNLDISGLAHGVAGLQAANINPAIKKAMIDALEGRGAVYHPETGIYSLEDSVRISRDFHIPGIKPRPLLNIAVNSPLAGIPEESSDILRNTLSIGGKRGRFYGFQLLGDGRYKLLVNDPRIEGGNAYSNESPILLGEKVHRLRSYNQVLSTSDTKSIVDMVVRLEDMGVSVGKDGLAVSEKFIANSFIPHLAFSARGNGRLEQFASKFGFDINSLNKSTDYISQAKGSNLYGKTGSMISSLLSMSKSELADIGLTQDDIKLLKLNNGSVEFNTNVLERLVSGTGKEFLGFTLRGIPAAQREGMLTYSAIGPKALKLRLNDYIPILRQKISQYGADSKLGGAYGIIDRYVSHNIYRGASKFRKTGLGKAATEIASIMLAGGNATKVTTGMLKGAKLASAYTIEQFLNTPSLQAVSDEVSYNAITKGFNIKALKGSVNDVNNRVAGFYLNLPSSVNVRLAGSGRDQVLNRIYMPSDAFLGAEPEGMSLFMPKAGGIRGLGLARRKRNILLQLHDEATAYRSINKGLEGFNLSKGLTKAISSFHYDLMNGLGGKGGLIHSNMVWNPKGAFRGGISLIDDGLEPFTIGLHPSEFNKILKRSRMKGLDSFYALVHGDPRHAPQNIASVRVVASKSAKKGTIQAGQWISQMKRDFDWDTLAGFTSKSIQKELADIHAGESLSYHAYHTLVNNKGIEEYSNLFQQISSNRLTTVIKTDKFLAQAGGDYALATMLALRARVGGAAGGAALTKSVDLFAKNLRNFGEALDPLGSQTRHVAIDAWSQAISTVDRDIGREMQFMAKAPIFKYLGVLQEAMAYANLSKSAGHTFGSESLSLPEALALYNKAPSNDNLTKVRNAISEGLFEHRPKVLGGSGATQLEQIYRELGINLTDEESVVREKLGGLADILTGVGTGHSGVGTLYRLSRLVGSKNAGVLAKTLYNRAESQAIPQEGITADQLEDVLARNRSGLEELVGPIEGSVAHTEAGRVAAIGSKTNAKVIKTLNQVIKEKATTLKGKLAEIMEHPWGGKMVIGAAAIGGLGLLDLMFGRDNTKEPEQPIYRPMMEAAPLPRDSTIQSADEGLQYANNFKYTNRPRLERPMASRQVYNIRGTAPDGVNFAGLANSKIGRAGIVPAKDSYVKDDRNSNMNNYEANYQIRQRLESSF